MPCSDNGARDFIEDHRVQSMEREHRAQVSRLSAMLCGLLTAAELTGQMELLLTSFDFKEAGITEQQLLTWWKVHKARDARRKEIERTASIIKDEL